MKLHKATTLPVLVIATMGIGAGTSYASPAPPDDTTITYQAPANPDPLSGVLEPHEVYSQSAYENMITQFEIGWTRGGNIGAGVGAVVGCVLFIFVGCIPGAAIGAITGASNANPALAPAFFDFVRTLP
ncbi:hypothetical protein [Rhodococcus daqingensis]|uniref:DUF4190 domain-containing protein n=1 Tax=Rhodococcus daqingensis TaxID=2479363 RepID=A0ABW2RTK3_9NOCA